MERGHYSRDTRRIEAFATLLVRNLFCGDVALTNYNMFIQFNHPDNDAQFTAAVIEGTVRYITR